MTEVEIPERMRHLPRNKAGYLVPWFVWVPEGKEPDFRVVRHHGIADAIRFSKCWLCGGHLGRWGTFVIGPMCAVNRVSAEPPSHRECAEYAVKVCPFLTRPDMVRRDRHLPEEHYTSGVMIERNPGVTLLWLSRSWKPFRTPDGGVLVNVGSPVLTEWYAHGRQATREEVLAAIESGVPILKETAAKEGVMALTELDAQLETALALVPA